MIVIKKTDEPTHIIFIPRVIYEYPVKIRLIDELLQEETEYENVEIVYLNGFMYLKIDYIFNLEDRNYSIDVLNETDYIYRGKIYVTEQEDLQNYNQNLIYV